MLRLDAGTALTDSPSPPDVRALLHRKVLASYRHRAAVARRLGMTESEVAAPAYLALGTTTPGRLAERLQLTSGGVTALLHRLERGGHVTRRAHPQDRRSVILRVAPATLERIVELYAPLAAATDEAMRQLSPQERRVVAAYLHEVAALSEQHADRLASPTDRLGDPPAPPAPAWA